MKIVNNVAEIINSTTIPKNSMVYTAGNASTPQVLLRQIIKDEQITSIDLLSLLLLGDIGELFAPEVCSRVTHRVLFSGEHSRIALNHGMAAYQMMHLSDIPHQLKNYLKPTVVLLTVAGPDNGGNFSYGSTVEGLQAAVDT
ncbi:MAG TPA: acetyl-CoA hydrolase, partial [Oceanospirillales bacterium]|nr:acetyl-CoA hydrolase [Oceanospirillales bacterium]